MPELRVEVDAVIAQALQAQAAAHSCNPEAEHREILRHHLLGGQPPQRAIRDILAEMPYFPEDTYLFEVR